MFHNIPLPLARMGDWTGWPFAGFGETFLPAAARMLFVIVVFAAVAALIVFLTELTSNVATASMAMPVMAGAAAGLGMEPLLLMTTAGLAASMAFMLPVATPPNAIVFSSGYLTIPQMARAGFLLNILSIVVITTAATLLIPYLLVR